MSEPEPTPKDGGIYFYYDKREGDGALQHIFAVPSAEDRERAAAAKVEADRRQAERDARTYCCEAFREQAGAMTSVSPIAGAYAGAGMGSDTQFEPNEDGTWAINGCCGGGCYVVDDMKFCPYCGAKL